MSNDFQVIVLGLGAVGSATAYQLAKSGQHILGIDQFAPPHSLGSTHGDTRIIRQAIGEGAHYTPLSLRSYEIWRQLERESGKSLLTITGGLIISSPSNTTSMHVAEFFNNTVAAAQAYHIAHELLSAPQIRARFPAFNVQNGELGYFEPGAGFLRPENCVVAQLEQAAHHGATIHTGESVLTFRQDSERVWVETKTGRYCAQNLVIAAGPWLPELLGAGYRRHFSVTRQVLLWFAAKASIEPFLVGNFPVFIWEPRGASQAIYGFPAIEGALGGVKVSSGSYGRSTAPNVMNRRIEPQEIADVHSNLVAPHFPGLSNRCVKSASCLYTVTSDAGFLIDRHPEFDRVILASPCSGHGFKHSAAIGEALAQMIIDGASRLDLNHCRFDRLINQGR